MKNTFGLLVTGLIVGGALVACSAETTRDASASDGASATSTAALTPDDFGHHHHGHHGPPPPPPGPHLFTSPTIAGYPVDCSTADNQWNQAPATDFCRMNGFGQAVNETGAYIAHGTAKFDNAFSAAYAICGGCTCKLTQVWCE